MGNLEPSYTERRVYVFTFILENQLKISRLPCDIHISGLKGIFENHKYTKFYNVHI